MQPMHLALVAHRHNETNLRLVEAAPPGVDFEIVPPAEALGLLGPGDAALARLDVLPSLDGIEPGIWEVGRLEADGVHVFNRLRTLLATHDKLQTARMLHAASLPHPAHRSHDRDARDCADRATGCRQASLRELGHATSRSARAAPSSWPASRSSRRARGSAARASSSRSSFRRSATTSGSSSPAGQVVGAVRRHAAEGGFDPVVASDGDIGLRRLRFETPDVCVVDLMLPRTDGWRLIESARSEGMGRRSSSSARGAQSTTGCTRSRSGRTTTS